jgi:ubiquinone/menaquinone biosynthesis C-methylase UbiE
VKSFIAALDYADKNAILRQPMKESISQQAYDELADSYAARIDTKPHNAYYERPATKSLIPEVSGQLVLDAGCGTGVMTDWLLSRGAQVFAVDANDRMLAHARKRIGNRAKFKRANLEEPLSSIEDGIFDGILSSLAITYIKDHTTLFSEFRRMLKLNGWLVFSTEHPFFSYRFFNIDNYFETKEVSCDWHGFDKVVRMSSYYHSLGEISEALSTNGFLIEKILEPKPIEQFEVADKAGYDKLMKFPLFICMRARKAA